MSKESFESFIHDNEKDIMKIESKPHLISYSDLYDIKECDKIKKIFIAVSTDTDENFTKGVIFVLKKLVPEFKDASPKDISLFHFSEGVTNKIVCATNLQNNFKVNVRIFGSFTEYVLDRNNELIVMNNLPKVKLYGTFLNGIIYTYIEGRTLTIGELIDIKTFNQTAKAIAKHHKLKPPFKKIPILFITLRKWISNVPLEYIEPEKKPYDINIIKKEIIFLEENLKNRSDVVFCHNDILLKNMIKNDKSIELIDYEYCAYNYRAYDLANHFNEWCGLELVWENYPSLDTRRRFLKEYLNEFYDDKKDEFDLEKEIDKIIEDIKWFDLASNFYWGTWGLIEAGFSSIDFNYCDYGRLRFKRYFELKKKLLESEKNKA